MQDTYTPPPEVQRLLRAVKARPPAGAGANLWDRQRLLDAPFLFHQLMAQAQLKREAADPTPTRTRKRKPTLAGVARQAALPPTLAPRLIGRDDAAAYVGVSPNTFDKMIAEGLMPSPRRLTERRLAWDMRQLDTAIDRLPIDGEAEADTDATDDHSWDDIDAQAKKKPIAR
jgi:predicted DNA-binding transcriptional regulator AlpA